jgi:hypothetical protein
VIHATKELYRSVSTILHGTEQHFLEGARGQAIMRWPTTGLRRCSGGDLLVPTYRGRLPGAAAPSDSACVS